MRKLVVFTTVLLLSGLSLASDPPAPAPAAPPTGDAPTLVMYDVRDLSPELVSFDDLAARARAAAGEKAEVQALPDRGVLVVRAVPDAQTKLRDLLDTLRRRLQHLVLVETRVIRTEGRLVPGLEDRGMLRLDAARAERLLEALDERAEVISSPTICARDGQRAKISMMNQLSFVVDLEVRRAGDEQTLVDPVVETLHEGLELSLRPVLIDGGSRVALLLRADVAAVRRPVEAARLEMHGEAEVTVQTPEVVRKTWRRAATIDAGSYLLLDLGVEPGEGKGRLAVLITAAEMVASERKEPRLERK